MSAQPKYDDLTVDTIAKALDCLNASAPRAEWIRVGMALKSGLGEKDGFKLFEDWSKTGDGFDAKDCASAWKSIKENRGVGIATLIYMAQQNGFRFDADAPKLTPEQIERRNREREEDARRAKAEERRLRGDAAKLANLLWNAAEPAGNNHPYLVAKQIQAHGLRMGEWVLFKKDSEEEWKRLPNTLLVPIIDAKTGKLMSLQGYVTEPDGGVGKRYMKNGAKRGGFHMIGTPPVDGQPLAFCEGYATGATIHELTGWCVIVCFDVGNLPIVAKAMREQFGDAPFLICADNDQFTVVDGKPQNPGMLQAEAAAEATRANVIAPQFANLDGEPTDWNDLYQREGASVALAQLLNNPVTRPAKSVTITTDAGDVPAAFNDNVDYYELFDFRTAQNKPKACIENVQELLRRLKTSVRYNVISKNLEIEIPGEKYLVDNAAGGPLARLKSECAKFDMGVERLSEFLLWIGDKDPLNPVLDYITLSPWDGVSRFADLMATIGTAPDYDRELLALLLRRWLISAVAAAAGGKQALDPNAEGFWSKGVLVFQGDQSLGKTTWFRQLVPPIHRKLIKVDATIDPNNKDTIISAASHWLVELGELDGTLRKADIARLKGFISQDMDQFRRPYGTVEERIPRRTAFFASVNPAQFLGDDTGNVRWWTVPCVSLDLTAHKAMDMQQVWAEVYTWFLAGEQWWLDADEEARLEGVNRKHEKVDPMAERIHTALEWDSGVGSWTWRTATDIARLIGIHNPTSGDVAKVGRAIRARHDIWLKATGEKILLDKKSNGTQFLKCPQLVGWGSSADDSGPF